MEAGRSWTSAPPADYFHLQLRRRTYNRTFNSSSTEIFPIIGSKLTLALQFVPQLPLACLVAAIGVLVPMAFTCESRCRIQWRNERSEKSLITDAIGRSCPFPRVRIPDD